MEDNGKKPTIKLRLILRGKAPEGGASPTCSLCARSFSSAKALCGHMRWHGKSPPPPALSSPPRLTDPVSLPPRQRPLLLRWARTAKRTPVVPVEMIHAEVFDQKEEKKQRKDAAAVNHPSKEICTVDEREKKEQRKDAATVEHSSEESCTVDEREVEQRKDAAAVEHPSEETCTVHEREEEEQRKDAAAVEHSSEESCTVDEREVEEKRKDAATVEHPSEESCTVDAGAVTSAEGDRPGALEQSGQTREQSEDRPPCSCCRRWLSRRHCNPAPPAPSFACGPCGRTFPSYHALCGHMASHPKQQYGPLSPQESHCYRSATSPAEGISRPEASKTRRGVKRARSAEHRCNVCGRVFPTGQSLGGHKRLHWQGPVNRTTLLLLPPAAATAGEHMLEKGTGTAARVHDFDLNETPMVEHGEAANGNVLMLLL